MKKIRHCPGGLHVPCSRLFTAALLLGAALLAGCAATSQPPRSLGTLPASDQAALNQLDAHVAEQSAKLAAVNEELRQRIEKKAPPVVPELISPRYDPLEDMLVTVKLQNATLSSILQVLAEQAHMNMLVDPDVLAIDKRASLYLNRVTARELYRHILESFDLSGQINGNTITITQFDERFFNLDFLNSNMSVNITAGGNVFGSSGSSGTSSSSGGSGGEQIRGNIALSGGSGKQIEPYDQLEANIKRIISAADTDAPQAADKDADKRRAVYSINRSSGTLFVRARPSQMRTVEKLTERYKLVLHRQVLIEAQLLDVELNDEFQYGVDWNVLRNHAAGIIGSTPMIASEVTAVPLPGIATTLPMRTLTFPALTVGNTAAQAAAGALYTDKNVAAAFNLLRSFGNVRVLSNPSIRVRNNSPALLSVGTSNRYVSKSAVTTSNPGGGASTTSSDVQTDSVFAGVVVGVVPFIGERGEVELLIHPMQTEVDPVSLQLVDIGGGNKVTLPKVSYKGMTTSLNMKDGDTVIIGGLIDQSTSNKDTGIPGLSDAPMLGRLFGPETSSHRSRELVMVLKVKVL